MLNLLKLKNKPILEQLQIEEALLRVSDENWCVINEGSPPSIVMGISGKPDELVNRAKLKENPIPLIKRYSGGGTVVVDDQTLFISLIFNKSQHDFSAFPEPILRWSADLYEKAWGLQGFALRENDYVLSEHKIGGNAQYIKKNRFVHHTTFLWDFEEEKMDYLLMPKKRPAYRRTRSHSKFLTTLKNHFPSKEECVAQFEKELRQRYAVKQAPIETALSLLQEDHRRTSLELPSDQFHSER